MKVKNKILSGVTCMTLLASVFSSTSFAATDNYVNGEYTSTIHMYKSADPTTTSMCDPIFDYDADVKLTDDSTVITFYVAYPIPAYSTLGTDGTLLDVVATYDGVDYTADLDMTSLTEREFDVTSALFGTTAGESYPTEVITLTLPAEAIEDALSEPGIYLSAYVNSVMNSTETFYLRLSDLTLVSAADDNEGSSGDADDTENDTEDSDATETTEQTATVTGTVEKNNSTYTVTVPSSITLGTLSKEEDTSVAYEIDVEAENLDGDSIEINASDKGSLVSDENEDNTIPFTNDLGTQTVTESTTLSGNIGVSASDVSSAKSRNYTGTTTFVINYFAAE